MADHLTPEKRSWNMAHIRSKDTSPEVMVRKYLFSKGFRYRKNVSSLPGKPDIVLPKYHSIIFVHGCFWHGHPGCKRANIPKSREEYWIPKLSRNIDNDKKHCSELISMGWKVIVIWECELKKKTFHETMNRVIHQLLEESNAYYNSQ